MNVTDEMVIRFLSWKLPKDFNPDCHVHFDLEAANAFYESWPAGTNLLTYAQAKEMLEHVLGGGNDRDNDRDIDIDDGC